MEVLASFDPLLDKFPIGAVCKNTKVYFSVKINENNNPKEVYFIFREDEWNECKIIKMENDKDKFIVNEEFKLNGHYFYYFKLVYEFGEKYLCKTYDNYSYLSDSVGENFVLIVTEEEYVSKDSLQGGIIYQIMVDRFCKVGDVSERKPLFLRDDWGGDIEKYTTDPIKINEQVFGGNFKGVISKLDYLKNLGVTAIYFTPISQANSHHKYDTADYMKVDDMFGTEEDFKSLVENAKEKNIKIIIDGVYNHTGSDSVYFNKKNSFDGVGAFNSKNSKYFNWYNFREFPSKYDCWWGIETLPSIKKDNLNFQNYIAGENGVIEKFMNMGVFGIRLDVIDELSDDFIQKISSKINTFGKNCVCMGEVWEDASTKISYDRRRNYFTNNQINSVMNYPLKDSILEFLKTKNPYSLNSTIRMLINNYPKTVLDNLMNFVGTHDTNRFFSEIKNICGLSDFKIDINKKVIVKNNEFFKLFSDVEFDKKTEYENKFNSLISILKIGYVLLFTMPGVPSIFYGDEYGMDNSGNNPRGCFNFEKCENEISEFIKNLAFLRKMKVFKDGEIKVLCSIDGKFIFERYDEKTQVIVLVNLGKSVLDIELKGNFKSYFTNKSFNSIKLNENMFDILISKNIRS